MRRIYYAFLLRQLAHPLFIHLAILVVSVFAFVHIVSVPDVWANLMEVRVREVGGFLFAALRNTEVDTIVWLTIIAAVLGSLIWRLGKDRRFVPEPEATWAR